MRRFLPYRIRKKEFNNTRVSECTQKGIKKILWNYFNKHPKIYVVLSFIRGKRKVYFSPLQYMKQYAK